ncbi:slipin family protein [Methermicoccus shengliensis]|uniref:Slipin family protein n=1 Tax=Methermicoccus shengliensis TaxID=660064 RepID=A0A832VN07_9EURY|nr:slipin family protein [Methermicoccus shengliensis]KUK04349.1 MAG: SPFH domain, Band 7 family protein [Euryarchaeota archaeon 55_53]KUK30164.1 MAG: SPFH domain, Band 7 family protein [Methanosarcinales archeaon 56_1174]MDI3488322.1 hypothetical protein [Methanosarcinales archaeon]MDN5294783.1 hypothetical protein [Methanosarcinales archaeon]HIH69841.1 slipin family protein [Methermicoccus shengliensis]
MVAYEYMGLALVVLLILYTSLRIIREYERAVIFRLGKFAGIKGPGIFFIIPLVDQVVKVDLRVVTVNVPAQEVITSDNVTVRVDAVVYYRITDPDKAIINVEDYQSATSLLSQTTLRTILGQFELDDLLQRREELNLKIAEELDAATENWGIKVSSVTIKDVILPESMLRAIAKQAEAERERRSRIILSDAELMASKKMREAAEEYEKTPIALKLRELQTLAEISREKNLIVISPSTGFSDMGAIIGMIKGMEKKEER